MTAQKALVVGVVVAVNLLALGSPASGQTALATIRGKVTDEQGAALPGVTMTIRQIETNTIRTNVSGGTGQYFVPNLPAGPYELRCELQGFSTQTKTGLVLLVGQEVTVDFVLKVGAVEETVNVIGEAALLETTRTQLGTTIKQAQIDELPVIERDFSSLALLAPGVTTGVGGNGATLSFNGQRGFVNQIFVDGASNVWEYYGRQASTFPQDWIQEFQVLTNSFAAEFGTSSGGVLNVITRSGSNRFNGRGYAFFRDAKFDTAPFAGFFDNGTPQYLDKTPPFTQRRWGGIVGGPVVKDRVFFFAGYENLLRKSSDVVGISDYWRATGIKTVLDVKRSDHPFIVKGDINVSTKNRLSVRYDRSMALETNQAPDGEIDTENGRQSFGGPVWNMVTNLTSTLTNSTFNEFRFFYGSNMPPTTCNASGTSGAGNLSKGPPGTFANLSYPGAVFGCPIFTGIEGEKNMALIDQFSFIRGHHQLKMGGQMNRIKTILDITNFHDGAWSFPEDLTFNINNPASYPDSFSGNVGELGYVMPLWKVGLFVQDTWNVQDSLTLNVGIRYDIDTAFTAPNAWVDAKNEDIVKEVGGQAPYPKTRLDKNNIAPRLGVVWTPTKDKKTTVRGAFGWFYDQNHTNFNGFYMLNDLISKGFISFNANSPITNPFWNAADPQQGIDALRAFFAKNFPYFPNLSSATSKHGIGIRDPNLQVPYTRQFSAGVSHEFIPGLVVDADLVMSRGIGGWVFINQNIQLVNGQYVTVDPRFTSVSMLRNEGWTKYNALQTQVQYRKEKANVSVAYTLAKTRSNYTTSIFGGGPTNPLDLNEDVGLDSSDRRHNATLNGSYLFPLDVQLSGIYSYRTGLPYTVTTRFQLDSDPFGDRPEARNSRRGAPMKNFDLRVTKIVRVAKRVEMSAFWEMFNVFNTTNFVNYAGSLEASNFGLPRGALEMRRQQLGFRVDF